MPLDAQSIAALAQLGLVDPTSEAQAEPSDHAEAESVPSKKLQNSQTGLLDAAAEVPPGEDSAELIGAKPELSAEENIAAEVARLLAGELGLGEETAVWHDQTFAEQLDKPLAVDRLGLYSVVAQLENEIKVQATEAQLEKCQTGTDLVRLYQSLVTSRDELAETKTS